MSQHEAATERKLQTTQVDITAAAGKKLSFMLINYLKQVLGPA